MERKCPKMPKGTPKNNQRKLEGNPKEPKVGKRKSKASQRPKGGSKGQNIRTITPGQPPARPLC